MSDARTKILYHRGELKEEFSTDSINLDHCVKAANNQMKISESDLKE